MCALRHFTELGMANAPIWIHIISQRNKSLNPKDIAMNKTKRKITAFKLTTWKKIASHIIKA